jgi:hypothetical protein
MPKYADNTVSVTEPQFVTCRFCQHEFVTELTVSNCADDDIGVAYGGELRRKLSRALASERVAKQLANLELCVPVPCPGCLRYQPYMVRQMAREPHRSRRLKPGWRLVGVGAFTTALSGAILLANPNAGTPAFVLSGVGVFLILLGGFFVSSVRRGASAFNPDADPETLRRRAAEEGTHTRADYDREQQRRARLLYAEHVPLPRDGNPYSEPEPLVITWWVLPSTLTDGGTILVELSEAQIATVTVPEVARNGAVLDLSVCPPGIRPFKVCVRAFRVHPDEYQPV